MPSSKRGRKTKALKNPITPLHSELFDLYVRKWVERLNLADWRVVRDKRPSPYMAEIFGFETPHKLARYKLGKHFGDTPVTAESLESTAIHEILHLRLHQLLEVAFKAGEYTDEVMAEEHSAIIVLEALLLRLAQLEESNAEGL